MSGTTPTESSAIIRTLRDLTDRLGAPDLTASESQTLLPELHRLIELSERTAVVPARPAGDRSLRRSLACCVLA